MGEGAKDREVFERGPAIGVSVWLARAAKEFDGLFRHELGGVPQIAQVNQRRWNMYRNPPNSIVVKDTGDSSTVFSRGGIGRHGQRQRRTDRHRSGL